MVPMIILTKGGPMQSTNVLVLKHIEVVFIIKIGEVTFNNKYFNNNYTYCYWATVIIFR